MSLWGKSLNANASAKNFFLPTHLFDVELNRVAGRGKKKIAEIDCWRVSLTASEIIEICKNKQRIKLDLHFAILFAKRGWSFRTKNEDFQLYDLWIFIFLERTWRAINVRKLIIRVAWGAPIIRLSNSFPNPNNTMIFRAGWKVEKVTLHDGTISVLRRQNCCIADIWTWFMWTIIMMF